MADIPGGKLAMVTDFHEVISDLTLSGRVLDYLEEVRRDGGKVVLLSDIDPRYWLKRRHIAKEMEHEDRYRWEAIIIESPTFRLPQLHGPCANPNSAPSTLRRTWRLCSEDEKMVLAGMHYQGILNYRNSSTAISLYRRRLVGFENFQLFYVDPEWEKFVKMRVSREEFHERASRYENKLWLSFRGPILLALLVTVIFIAYVAQDEMKIAFSLLGTVGGTLATVGVFSERIKAFRAYLGGG